VLRTGRGFTLAEILIATVIVVVLAAAVGPAVMGRLDNARGDAIVAELQSLQNGINLYYQDMARYPRDLTYLNGLPAGTKQDACGNTMPTVNESRFRGSYINRPISLTSGRYILTTGDSVDATLYRDSLITATGGSRAILQIYVYGPEQSIAEYIDMKVDGEVNKNAGIIRWVATNANEYTVKWAIPIRVGAC
jgi:prepilin-type N-terminal cleavage/methylation domain-containing protein